MSQQATSPATSLFMGFKLDPDFTKITLFSMNSESQEIRDYTMDLVHDKQRFSEWNKAGVPKNLDVQATRARYKILEALQAQQLLSPSKLVSENIQTLKDLEVLS